MSKLRYEEILPKIEVHFGKIDNILSPREIANEYYNLRTTLVFPQNATLPNFLSFLEKKSKLKKTSLDLKPRKKTRYTWGLASMYDIVQSLDQDAYFSHLSAAYFNGLISEPNEIFLNIEQTPKPTIRLPLEQGAVDRALKGKPRITTNSCKANDFQVTVLNGKFTNKCGVVPAKHNGRTKLMTTDLERTLIDCAVRPFYAGGVKQVATFFKKALDQLKPDKIVEYLKTLDHVYPYQQVIGFYLEKAGCDQSVLAAIESQTTKIDFYLTYQISNPAYSKRWRLYHPKEI